MSVTLHTDVGDIKIEVFCERTPKTCENFLALCASNYYNGCIFHRNIKGFMVQTGDPTGTGRGGNSIWGKKFEDEYSEYLKILFIHERHRESKRQRHRQREKQAPCREPDAGLHPGTPESCPGPKADAKLLSHPEIPR
uniref:peptidyl-prolyl cis-trans isomerase-like 3 isoform X3 n=1 Tax=Nyctereutes procyonoides TaxID=34880 RepID=UPI002443F91F|nr:peptidyl-prolyl cis-trans isomerase-like 3 isoform X3 [Nyctereutes procyonoides]